MKKLLPNLLLSYSSSLFSFIIILVLARLLGAENFYWVALGLAAGGFVAPLINFGSERTFVRDAVGAGANETVDKMVLSNLGQRLVVCLAVSVALVLASNFYTSNIADAISMVSLSLWAGLIGLYPTSWFDYSHDTRRQNFFGLSERICSVFLIGLLYFYTKVPADTASIGLFLLTIRVLFIYLQVKSWWFHHATTHFQLKLSLPRQNGNGINFQIAIASFANSCVGYGNQLILAANNNSIELSAYSLAFQIMMIALIFQGQAIRVTSRSIAEACSLKGTVLVSLIYNTSLLFLGSIILAIGAWVALQILPNFLEDPRFEAMAEFSIFLCIWVVLSGIGLSITQHNLALNQENLYLQTAIGGALVALLLGFLFIPNYGALAAALILLFVHSSMILINTIRLLYVIHVREA